MSIQSKYPGKCKDCKVSFLKGTIISTNHNDNWCSKGKECPGYTTPNINTTSNITNNITASQNTLITANLDLLISLEKIITAKLGPDTNPAKIGMYMKFLYEGIKNVQ